MLRDLRLGKMIELTVGEGAPLPTEFRIFRSGVNETSQGPIVFDAEAAQSVMAAFAAHGVDMMIDLAHDSVDDAARANRSDADDARGWCGLEVRSGELWAINVSWTPDGARRLTERTQRYVSPVVFIDEDTNRAIELFNIALCSMPATHNAAPLVAARRRLNILAAPAAPLEIKSMTGKQILAAVKAARAGDEAALVALEMSPAQAKKAIAAVKDQSGDAALSLVEELLASALGADSESEEAPADAAPAEPLADAPADPTKDEEAAMGRALRAALRVDSPTAVVAEVTRLRDEVAALTLARNADERNERIGLIGELVKIGVELPATAWKDADKREPTDVLASMPMAALRARVAAFRAAPRATIEAPEGSDEELTPKEKQLADKMSPEARAVFVAARSARRAK